MKTESVSHCDEVITGSSAAADYVNFTGHSLLGHNFFFYVFCLGESFAFGNELTGV